MHQSGWKFHEQADSIDWWLGKYWKIKSIQKSWGMELYILFLINPEYEKPNDVVANI